MEMAMERDRVCDLSVVVPGLKDESLVTTLVS